MKTIDEHLERAFELKQQIDTATREMRDINVFLAEETDFNGKKSATIQGKNIKAKVVLRDNVKWNQKNLATVRQHFECFDDAFKTEFKPDAKALAAHASADPEFAKAVDWCRTITPGSPSVTYELIDGEEEVMNAA